MKSIYLVLDMQNDLVNADGPNGQSPLGVQVRERDVVEKTRRSIAKARASGVAVGFVRVGFSAGYKECPDNSPIFSGMRDAGLLRLDTWGGNVHPALEPRDDDLHVIKHRVSPFYSTALVAQLSARRIDRIYCSGVSTQAVVQATVRDAHDRDYSVVLLEDCCAAHSAEEHQHSTQSLNRFCVVTTSETVCF